MKKLNAERQKVLIETQWNVKRNPVEIHGNTYCINRNIVECKDRRTPERRTVMRGINRNIVECKVE